jgi:hypothetical protein
VRTVRLSSRTADVLEWDSAICTQPNTVQKRSVTFVCLRKLRNAESVMSEVVNYREVVHYTCFTTGGMA